MSKTGDAASMPDSPLVELVAQAIYKNSAGMVEDEYEEAMGEPRRGWKADDPEKEDPEHELCEWERDEYRLMAKAAIKAVLGD